MVGHNVGSTTRTSNQKDGLPRRFTPYATAGFFKFKDKIPKLIGTLKGIEVA